METSHGQTFIIQGIPVAFPMEEFQYGTAAVRKHIDIPVQGIQMAGTDGTAQAVNALAQVYWIAAHYKTVVLIQVEMAFLSTKVGTS